MLGGVLWDFWNVKKVYWLKRVAGTWQCCLITSQIKRMRTLEFYLPVRSIQLSVSFPVLRRFRRRRTADQRAKEPGWERPQRGSEPPVESLVSTAKSIGGLCFGRRWCGSARQDCKYLDSTTNGCYCAAVVIRWIILTWKPSDVLKAPMVCQTRAAGTIQISTSICILSMIYWCFNPSWMWDTLLMVLLLWPFHKWLYQCLSPFFFLHYTNVTMHFPDVTSNSFSFW